MGPRVHNEAGIDESHRGADFDFGILDDVGLLNVNNAAACGDTK